MKNEIAIFHPGGFMSFDANDLGISDVMKADRNEIIVATQKAAEQRGWDVSDVTFDFGRIQSTGTAILNFHQSPRYLRKKR